MDSKLTRKPQSTMACSFSGIRHASLPLDASEHLLRASAYAFLVADSIDRSENDLPGPSRGAEHDPRQHAADSLWASEIDRSTAAMFL